MEKLGSNQAHFDDTAADRRLDLYFQAKIRVVEALRDACDELMVGVDAVLIDPGRARNDPVGHHIVKLISGNHEQVVKIPHDVFVREEQFKRIAVPLLIDAVNRLRA